MEPDLDPYYTRHDNDGTATIINVCFLAIIIIACSYIVYRLIHG